MLLHSARRTDAVVLEALMAIRPDHRLIPKLARGLLEHREAGQWGSTQENGFAIVALDRHFRQYEGNAPDFVARAWLGERYAGEHHFSGHNPERWQTHVPMAWLTDPAGEHKLILNKEGEGRMYYRIGMRHAPSSLAMEAADHGFVVARRYEAIDHPDDVRRDDDGTWRIRAGARVRAVLTMVAPERRTHVALVDPLPAGLEAHHPEQVGSPGVPDANAEGPWFRHQKTSTERVEAFTDLLHAGVYRYSYVATATTPGHFMVPPATSEERYNPETFGRSTSDRVIIE